MTATVKFQAVLVLTLDDGRVVELYQHDGDAAQKRAQALAIADAINAPVDKGQPL